MSLEQVQGFYNFSDPKSPMPNHIVDVTDVPQVHSSVPGIPPGSGSHTASHILVLHPWYSVSHGQS